jgi:uncharacterized C2H2 Zn-finger protein
MLNILAVSTNVDTVMETLGSMTQCTECNKMLKKKSLARHMREIHPKNENMLNCPHCDKSFARKSNLSRHIESNHSDSVKADKEQSAPTNKDKKFNCNVCGLFFKQKCHYTEHLQIHQGFRFECQHCKKSFSRATTLKQHMLATHPTVPADSSNSVSGDFKMAGGKVSEYGVASARYNGDRSSHVAGGHASRCNHQHGHKQHCHQRNQTSTHADHSSCTKVAYLQHDDHIDFLHSCGSVFCHDEEVPFGQAPYTHENLHSMVVRAPETRDSAVSPEHSSCTSVAYLPHGSHVDFLHSCGNVSCRDESRPLHATAVQSSHNHEGCTKVAYLQHDNHIDFLHSCGSLFCQDEEVSFGEAPRTHDNLHSMVANNSVLPIVVADEVLHGGASGQRVAKKPRNTSSPTHNAKPDDSSSNYLFSPSARHDENLCNIDQDMVSSFCSFFE